MGTGFAAKTRVRDFLFKVENGDDDFIGQRDEFVLPLAIDGCASNKQTDRRDAARALRHLRNLAANSQFGGPLAGSINHETMRGHIVGMVAVSHNLMLES